MDQDEDGEGERGLWGPHLVGCLLRPQVERWGGRSSLKSCLGPGLAEREESVNKGRWL